MSSSWAISESSLPIDSTDGWLGDTVQVPEPEMRKAPLKDSSNDISQKPGDYDVVIGIFGEYSNANKQIKKLKDFGYDNAYSFKKSSMNVVSAGRFDKNEAQKIASDLNDKGFDAVVKRR